MSALALLAAASAGAALPNFRLGQHEAGVPYDLRALPQKDCQRDGEVISCTETVNASGGWAVLTYSILDRKLARLSLTGVREALPEMLQDLRNRYGEPCDSGDDQASNGLGMPVVSRSLTWCFRTGRLTLHERYLRVNYYGLIYTDDIAMAP